MLDSIAKVYYQDIEENFLSALGGSLALDQEKSVYVGMLAFDSEKEDRAEVCDRCFKIFNCLDIPVGHPDRPLFERAGHTSMSVGDYVLFEDGEIRICASEGWEIK